MIVEALPLREHATALAGMVLALAVLHIVSSYVVRSRKRLQRNLGRRQETMSAMKDTPDSDFIARGFASLRAARATGQYSSAASVINKLEKRLAKARKAAGPAGKRLPLSR